MLGLGWVGKQLGKGAIRNAPRQLIEGILDIVEAPGARLVGHYERLWNSLESEDQRRVIELARVVADMAIKYGRKKEW